MTDVLTLGEAMVSVRTAAPMRLGGAAQLSVAGSESNVAIGLARLGHDVCWVGAVGDDQPGNLVRRTLRAEGVDTRFARAARGAFTGFVAFDQPAHDITRVSYHRAGSAGSTLTAKECSVALSSTFPRLVHLTGITPALSQTAREAVLATARAAHAAGIRVSLDVNYRERLWPRPQAAAVLRELLPLLHTVFASADELDLLSAAADPVAELLARGVAQVVVTAGADGAHCHTPGGSRYQPALRVAVVDSVGAGDAFVSGYLSGALDGLTAEERLRRAATAGAFCVGAHGDWEALPSRAGLALLARGDGAALR
ncbi:sugar kinase [Streptacidiphilus sp. P02-A3a]|uniref:sugar kinase n=1 Tax=Streptacidiphilus sp. P02-A3a TaxID=2704468 RepID=UPI0015FC354A|nr:sugar kinase [Streptacidiphilus sp. P02-A3a]QMU70160.1 sugar kinase [Streptacidiphilus sp. P02-A3a]QMU70390.1 sugar kinase [Streptacidiphilus sp. P02-A3a]